jgi:hypothetical protein
MKNLQICSSRKTNPIQTQTKPIKLSLGELALSAVERVEWTQFPKTETNRREFVDLTPNGSSRASEPIDKAFVFVYCVVVTQVVSYQVMQFAREVKNGQRYKPSSVLQKIAYDFGGGHIRPEL